VTGRRHLIIPDVQIKPGDDTTHLTWAANAILKYRPDVIVVLGDWWDMPSLSTHDGPGSKEAEGARVQNDIDAGIQAWDDFWHPIEIEQLRVASNRKKQYRPECHFLFGNHEDRITRALFRDPKWDGILSLDSLKTPTCFARHPFLKIVNVDGIKFCHFFPNPFSGRPIGGTIPNRLSHIGSSFVQGHQQGHMYGSKAYPDCTKHGIVCGRFYTRNEHYRPEDIQNVEWNGIIMLNGVHGGDFDIMPLRIDYLRREFS